jgi:hypothetical protein
VRGGPAFKGLCAEVLCAEAPRRYDPLQNGRPQTHVRTMTEVNDARDRAPRDAGAAEFHSKKPLTPAAERALAEAAERRARPQTQEAGVAKELGGPSGPEPTRYGDWEKKGLTSDF